MNPQEERKMMNRRVIGLNPEKEKLYHEVKILIPDEDWPKIRLYVLLLPDEYQKDFLNMLAVGFKIDGAFYTLKETYNF